jgi:hypothetical protein
MSHYFCVHGHFYQPPRANPENGVVPLEPGAYPFHDFNEKILSECYRPNGELGNYDRMSFDIGPTLGQWMREHHTAVLDRIVEADRRAVAERGYGNAVAQSFHHTILPFANERDRRTELRWGIRWFEHTFGRRPLGIWLPETAVDIPTLEACVAEGLTFTIFSPEQADERIDTRQPYRVDLPSGAAIDVVFYEGPLSGTVSFNPHDTDSADDFMRRFVLPRFHHRSDRPVENPAVVIASDGEVYGHHHRFKDHFLHDLLTARAPAHKIEVVSIEHYLGLEPSRQPVKIKERSSWGCGHELMRWNGDCPCTAGDGTWKRELRRAFNRLAQRMDQETDDAASRFDLLPWSLRDDYVDVVIGVATPDVWLRRHEIDPGSDRGNGALTLMEAQRFRLAMYASCAFYWDDLTRLEAGYGVRSALYASSLFDSEFGTDLRAGFERDLESVSGWKSEKSAAELYARTA